MSESNILPVVSFWLQLSHCHNSLAWPWLGCPCFLDNKINFKIKFKIELLQFYTYRTIIVLQYYRFYRYRISLTSTLANLRLKTPRNMTVLMASKSSVFPPRSRRLQRVSSKARRFHLKVYIYSSALHPWNHTGVAVWKIWRLLSRYTALDRNAQATI